MHVQRGGRMPDHRSTLPDQASPARLSRALRRPHDPRPLPSNPIARRGLPPAVYQDLPKSAVLLAGLTTACILASASLLISAIMIKAVSDHRIDGRSTLFVGLGAVVGTCIGSWAAQPAVTRLIARLYRVSRNSGPHDHHSSDPVTYRWPPRPRSDQRDSGVGNRTQAPQADS